MEDDAVVVAALGEGGEVGAGLRGGLLVGLKSWEKRRGIKGRWRGLCVL